MKRILVLVMVLVLFMFSTCTAEGFFFGSYTAEHSLHAVAVIGDQYVLYDTIGSHYCLYRGETLLSDLSSRTNFDTNDKMQRIYRSALCVVSDEQSFYGIEMNLDENYNTSTVKFGRGEVHRLNFENNTTELVAELDVSPAIVKQEGSSIESMMRFIGAALSGNNLYLVFEVPLSQVESGVFFADEADIEHFALRYELGNPTPQRISLAGGAKLIAAQGSTILYSALTADSNDVQICMLDTTTDQRTVLQTISGKEGRPAHFAYDIPNAKLYYNLNGQVFEMDATGKTTLVALFPFQDIQGLFLLSGNQIGAWTTEAWELRTIDPNAKDNIVKLSVYGGLNNSLIEDFMRANPSISIVDANSDVSLIDTVLTKSSTPDVLFMRTVTDPAFIDLRERGYLLPLESEAVQSVISKMYPDIVKNVTSNGSVVALPISQTTQPMLGIDMAVWNEMNLGNAPTTWDEMFDLIERWPEILKDHRFVSLFNPELINDDARYILFRRMLNDYEYYRRDQSEPTGYNTEIFRHLLDRFSAIDFREVFKPQLASANQTLMISDLSPSARTVDEEMTPLALKVSEGAQSYMATTLNVVAINPYSKNIEAAKAFVDYCAENLDPLARVELMPDENAPLRPDNYDRTLESQKETVAEAQRLLDACENEVDRQPLEESLASKQSILEMFEDSWIASESSIAQYRAVAEHIYVYSLDSIDISNAASLGDVINRYLSGELPAESLIGELERRYVMRAQEQN